MDAENLDELMNCDNIWEDEEFTCPRSPSAISYKGSLIGESISTCTSWGSCTDSEISELIAPSNQNVDVEIRRVCRTFLNFENLEIVEDETESSSTLSIRPFSGISSSSITTAITEAAKTHVAVSQEELRSSPFCQDNKEEALASKFNHRRKRSLWQNKRIHPAPEEHLVEADNNQDDMAETKARKSKGLFSLFRSIFSKKKTKKDNKNKKASAEEQTKWHPVWMQLFHPK